MDKQEFVAALEEVLMLDKGSLSPETELATLDSWDSMGVLEFQAMADEKLGVQIEPSQIENCQAVDDLWKMVSAGKAG